MNQHQEDQRSLKSYLLGELSQEEARRLLEERILTDDAFFEELLIAEDELIDDYLKNALTDEEKSRFEDHFLLTEERRRKLKFARALKKYVSEETFEATEKAPAIVLKPQHTSRLSAFFGSPLRAVAAVLILAALGAGFWRLFLYQSDVMKGMLALKSAYREQRPTEARITGFDYAPLGQTRGGESTRVDNASLSRAERYLKDAADDHPGADSFHALGRYYLAEQRFDQAIEQFKKALKTKPDDAQLRADLGAAFLEKGKLDKLNKEEGKGAEDFAESLEHLNRAIELNPTQLEAVFNRALSHMYMGLAEEARADWRLYLEKDPNSSWANEARQYLKQIESEEDRKSKVSQNKEQLLQDFLNAYRTGDEESAWQIISLNRDVSGGSVENALLDAYLQARSEGREDAAQDKLRALSFAAQLELNRAGDHFLSDLTAFYRTATQPRQAQIIEARRLMTFGHKKLNDNDPESALDYYWKAQRIFNLAGDEGESVYAEYPLGHAQLLNHRSETSLSIFRRVARSAESKHYEWLYAQALNALANVQIGLNDYSTAIDNSNRSREISERINDLSGLMKTADQLAIEYTRLGNYHKAIEEQERGLSLFAKAPAPPRQMWRSYFLMAAPLNLLGLNAAAADFQKEALRIAQDSKNSYSMCRSYIGLGLIYGSQHNYEEATKNVRLAFDLAKGIESAATRADTLAYASLQLGHLYRQAGDFDKAAASYEQVIQTYGGADYPAFNYAAHKGKLLSCIAQGGCASVEQEIETTLDLFENYRSKISEEENKLSFFDAEQNVYDVAIDYEYSTKHKADMAFELSERSRARSLLDLTRKETDVVESHDEHKRSARQVARPAGLAEIQTRMPEEAQIVQYSVLENRTLIWVVSKSQTLSFEQPIGSKELRDRVSNYLQLISDTPANNEEEVGRAAEDLYDLLIKPLEPFLDRGKQLCIVPDKVLSYLPFAALVSRSSGKYLTQEFTLTLAPSSNIFIVCSENARRKEGADEERLLSVGNPSFDHKVFPRLADLPTAKREAEEVAAFYNSLPALTGDAAIKKRVISEMERASIIHLALHSVVNEQTPLRSQLVLAKEEQPEYEGLEDGVLRASEIYNLRLGQARLVVLSACQTGAERYYGGEGMISISRPFIAIGVPLVVASLWPVDSAATEELMVSFHKHRKQDRHSTAEALRLAQQEMLTKPEGRYRQPYYWASFITIGGYARF
ncbi:MAG: CHAT domain-containing protein [Acidobacteriota bacterium]|nr:CHAT domain-containing protein [Acidobacteriota bacterium]